MNIALSKEAERDVDRLLASGEFATAEEAVTEALRLLRREREIDAALAEGERDFEAGRFRDGEDVFRDLKQIARKRVEGEAT